MWPVTGWTNVRCDVVTYSVMIYLSSSCLTQISPGPRQRNMNHWEPDLCVSCHPTQAWSIRYCQLSHYQDNLSSSLYNLFLLVSIHSVTHALHLTDNWTEFLNAPIKEGWLFIVIIDPLVKVVIIDNNRGFISEGYLPLLLIMIWYFS